MYQSAGRNTWHITFRNGFIWKNTIQRLDHFEISQGIHIITDFEIVGPYTLRLTFDDRAEPTIDFEPMLHGELYSPLRELRVFYQVRLDSEAGTIVWENGADFDPATLYDWDQVGPAMIEMAGKWEIEPRSMLTH